MMVTMTDPRSSSGRKNLAATSRHIAFVCLVILATVTTANAGPTNFRMKRMMREAYSDTETSNNSNSTMSQDTCMLDGSLVPRSTVSCEKKAGCRAIQKTGECCPEYQCECTRDEKVYGNGEKLTDPETPCRVCYCQGGEISCSPVTCYIRNDCEPKFINGRCCPEYDNCPPLEHVKFPTSTTTTQSSGELVKESNPEKRHSVTNTPPTEAPTSTTTTTSAPDIPVNNNPSQFKIKETTKVEEIRITDEKPKDAAFTKIKNGEIASKTHLSELKKAKEANMESSALTSSGESTSGIPSTTSAESMLVSSTDKSSASSISATVVTSTTTEETVNLKNADANYNVDEKDGSKTVRHTDNDTKHFLEGRDRVFLSDNNIVNSSQQSDETQEQKNKSKEEAIRNLQQDSVVEASEHQPTSVVTDHSRPSVLQIGDKLVIVDHSLAQPIKVITVKEVAGLQRGTDENEGGNAEEETHHLAATTERRVEPESTTNSVLKVKSELEPMSAEQKSDETTTKAEDDITVAPFETVYHSGDSSSEVVHETHHFTEGPSMLNSSPKINADIQLDNFDHVASSSDEFVQVLSSSFKTSLTDDELTTQGASISGEEHSFRLDLTSSVESSGGGIDTILYTEGPSEFLNGSSEIIFDTKVFDDSNSTEDTLNLNTHDHDNSLETFSSTTQAPHGLYDEPADITRKTYIEDDETPNHVLIDPGYAPIPEDLSIVSRERETQGHLPPLTDEEAFNIEQRSNCRTENRLEVVLNKTEPEIELNTTALYSIELGSNETESAPEDLAIPNFSNEDSDRLLEFLNENNTTLNIQERSPGEPLLIPEWERVNGTEADNATEVTADAVSFKSPGEPNLVPEWERLEGTTVTVDTTVGPSSTPSLSNLDLAIEQAMASLRLDSNVPTESTDQPIASEKLITSHVKHPEPTTSRTPVVADILDDTSSSAVAASIEISETLSHNPKDDAESLKYESNDESDAHQFIKNLESNNNYDKYLENFPKWRIF